MTYLRLELYVWSAHTFPSLLHVPCLCSLTLVLPFCTGLYIMLSHDLFFNCSISNGLTAIEFIYCNKLDSSKTMLWIIPGSDNMLSVSLGISLSALYVYCSAGPFINNRKLAHCKMPASSIMLHQNCRTAFVSHEYSIGLKGIFNHSFTSRKMGSYNQPSHYIGDGKH